MTNEEKLNSRGFVKTPDGDYLVPGAKLSEREALQIFEENLGIAFIPYGSLIVPPDMIQEWAQRVIEGKMDTNDFEYKGL